MNVAVINLRDIFKYFVRILALFFLIYICSHFFIHSTQGLKQRLETNISSKFFITCLELTMPKLQKNEISLKKQIKTTNLLSMEVATFNPNFRTKQDITNEKVRDENIVVAEEKPVVNENTSPSPQIHIPAVAQTERVQDRNYVPTVTNRYGNTTIDNQCNYDLTEDMLIPDVELTNKKDVLIYHTHTCESYTPSENYNYEMTGNYRTTDSNFNVVRVGRELTTELQSKGFNVVHDETYHDYPSYSGSYARSLQTAENQLYGKDTDIVIDMHRDAMGNGDTYGPTLMVDGQRVAQLMFVIGTDGGGLEHPNWVQNLKIAIRIQETGNQMYPGLFRSIIVRNSRYNQHLAKGASIIEVGATANTMDECLLSMQCLANVLEEVCK